MRRFTAARSIVEGDVITARLDVTEGTATFAVIYIPYASVSGLNCQPVLASPKVRVSLPMQA